MPRNSRDVEATNLQSQTSLSQRLSRIPLLRRWAIPSNSTPPAITSTLAPAQPSHLVPSQQPSSSQFQHAKNFNIHGGQFTTELGPHLTIHMTQNGGQHPVPRVQPTPSSDQDEQTSGDLEMTNSKSMPSEDGDTAAHGSTVPSRSRLPYEIYATHLAPKRVGWALWMPEPNNNLPSPYRKKGVQFGDVGIIAPDGSFSFIFNIYLSRDDPINPRYPRSLPEEFVPIDRSIDRADVRRFAAFKAGSHLASTSVEKIEDDAISPALSFRSSGSEGAILTMPDGAISEDLEDLRGFREYAAANVRMWYKYIIGTRGREVNNGDVRLVVGCDKATSWGVAALPNTSQHSKLKFKPPDSQVSGSRSCGYTWEHSGTADVRDGPDQEEIDELREDPEDSEVQDKYLNQCLFVRTLNLNLSADDWEKFNHEIGIGHTLDSITEHGNGTPSRSPSNRGPSSESTQTTSSAIGSVGSPRTVSDSLTSNRLTISIPPAAISCHPSRIVNETLLKKIPNARMAITHDEDWYSCIQEDLTMPSDPDQILASLLTTNVIREDDGVVYLESKVTREMKYFADLEKLSIAGDSQTRSGYKEKESVRSSVQQSSSRPDPRSRGTDDDYGIGGQGWVGSYRGEVGGGISGHPSDSSQTRSGYKEKESTELPVQQSSSRDPRGRGTDTDFVGGSFRTEVGGGPSGMSQQPWDVGQPSASDDSQTRSGRKEKEKERSSTQQSSSRPDPRARGTDDDYVFRRSGSIGGYRGEVAGGISGHPSDSSQTRSGYKEESVRSSGQQSSSRQDPRVRGKDEDVAGSQAMSGLSSRIPYTERDPRASIIPTETLDTTAHSSESRSAPNPTTSIPQRKEDDSPPYNTRGSGWGREGSSQPADPSRTKPYGPYSPTDTTRSPQYEAPYTHPSKVQGSVGSQRAENTWGAESSRPTSRNPSSNPFVDTTGSHPLGGQPNAPLPGWSANPPHPGSIVAPAMRRSQISRRGSAGEGDKDTRSFTTTSTHPSQRKLTDIVESQVYNISQQTLPYKTQPLGNPSLVPFIKRKDNENLGLSKNIDSHIPLYMCSNIIDTDTIAFWFPAPTLFPSSGGRRGVRLGDLGYFDDSGEFRPIFNIFHSYEENIAEGARPPSQPYQHLPIARAWVRHVDIQRQQMYTSSNIEKRGEVGPHTQNSYQFRTYKQSGRSGAIIVLPHGGSSSRIRNAYFYLPEVKRHFREYAPSWYQHALPHMPKKINGSLVLVRATHCARSWGIAAFSSKQDIRGSLTANFISNPANEYQHMWKTNDSKWKTSAGPSSLELKELGGREPPLNQCVGVVISSLRLDDATWKTNFESLSSPSSSSDRGAGAWDSLRRMLSPDAWSTIHVNDISGSRLLDSVRGKPTDIRQAGGGDDDYTLLLPEP